MSSALGIRERFRCHVLVLKGNRHTSASCSMAAWRCSLRARSSIVSPWQHFGFCCRLRNDDAYVQLRKFICQHCSLNLAQYISYAIAKAERNNRAQPPRPKRGADTWSGVMSQQRMRKLCRKPASPESLVFRKMNTFNPNLICSRVLVRCDFLLVGRCARCRTECMKGSGT